MKKKAITILVIVLLAAGIGGYLVYSRYLRFMDAFTACPVSAFRTAASTPDTAIAFVSEAALKSLVTTEKCSLDCDHGNTAACVLYAAALRKGVFLLANPADADALLKDTCAKGEQLACQVEKSIADTAAAEAKAKVAAEEAKASAEAREALVASRTAVQRMSEESLDYFKGKTLPMTTEAMNKWYEDTIRFLLYDKPKLCKLHHIEGHDPMNVGLEEFAISKYTGGAEKPDLPTIMEFFGELNRLGVGQIQLDERVEKKPESEIPINHPYFKAKRTFLWRVAQVELKVLDLVEKSLSSK
ncbi:MAG: hypothetical protein PHU25_01355 [Deltaproteobacteria bacterium]|nr:hypothetical protein [Deltaproteobacteria bacterium]